MEAFQSQRGEGPCHDAYQDGRPVLIADVADAVGRWPAFAPVALERGVRSVHAVPLRLRDQVLGALGLFGSATGDLNESDLRLAQGLADVTAIALVQDRLADDRDLVNAQLQTALDGRVVLEQAKGVLSQRGLSMPDAYAALRQYARDHNLKIADLARAVVQRTVRADTVLDHSSSVRSRAE